MATQSAVFTFALPEDTDSDQLLIKSSATKDGTYSTDDTVTYEYGATTHEFDSLDDTKWYKVQFNNSTDSETGPISDAVYGGNFSNASPFLAVSTKYDGANYATTQDIYDYSTLTTSDVTVTRVSQSLRRARAIVDLKTADLDVDRFTRTFSTDTSRKKYNAALRILKESEILIALSNVYKGMGDDLVIKSTRESLAGTSSTVSSISIGSTSVQESGAGTDSQTLKDLLFLSLDYKTQGMELLDSISSNSVRLHAESDFVASPKFKLPFNGF